MALGLGTSSSLVEQTGTYTFPSGSTGATADMGAYNTNRYVNATNVYAKGKEDGATFKVVTGSFSKPGYSSWDIPFTPTTMGVPAGTYMVWVVANLASQSSIEFSSYSGGVLNYYMSSTSKHYAAALPDINTYGTITFSAYNGLPSTVNYTIYLMAI